MMADKIQKVLGWHSSGNDSDFRWGEAHESDLLCHPV